MMKGFMLFAFCLIFLVLSLSINQALASWIKTFLAWGCLLFLALVFREIWKMKYGVCKGDKWDEDP